MLRPRPGQCAASCLRLCCRLTVAAAEFETVSMQHESSNHAVLALRDHPVLRALHPAQLAWQVVDLRCEFCVAIFEVLPPCLRQSDIALKLTFHCLKLLVVILRGELVVGVVGLPGRCLRSALPRPTWRSCCSAATRCALDLNPPRFEFERLVEARLSPTHRTATLNARRRSMWHTRMCAQRQP